jgi:hypothetical protein
VKGKIEKAGNIKKNFAKVDWNQRYRNGNYVYILKNNKTRNLKELHWLVTTAKISCS